MANINVKTGWNIDGKYLDIGNAFEVGYQLVTNGMGSMNPGRSVKTYYENKLQKYLKNLPADTDMSQMPDSYRQPVSDFLINQKTKYAKIASQMDYYMPGTKAYSQQVQQMNQIKLSFENLDKQMKLYGQNKVELIDNIEGQTTSLHPSNQANINLLRGVYNEEYPIQIDDYGNISFTGDDGVVSLNDLPDYEGKDYKTAEQMMNMGVQVYKNAAQSGIVLSPEGILYNQLKNKLNIAIDKGGPNTLMSVIYDGLVGNQELINIPLIAEQVSQYTNGKLGFEILRKTVVDYFMNSLVGQSKIGVKNYKVNPTQSSAGYYAPEYYTDDKGQRRMFEKHKTDSSKDKYTVLKGTEVSGGGDSNTKTDDNSPVVNDVEAKSFDDLKKEFPDKSPGELAKIASERNIPIN